MPKNGALVILVQDGAYLPELVSGLAFGAAQKNDINGILKMRTML
jgi:hypothetical protein